MAELPHLDHDSSAVQKHLEIVQGIIARMSENSRSCKVWCITLVSAVLVLVVRTEDIEYAFIALVPAGLLLILDTYYLALERAFRKSYDIFICKLHRGKLTPADLYTVKRLGSMSKHVLSSLKSFSILPFYLAVLVMVSLVWWVANQ